MIILKEITDKDSFDKLKDNTIYEFSIKKSDGSPLNLTNAGTMRVTVPAGSAANPESKEIYFVDNNHIIEKCNTTYDPDSNTYTFLTDHNSYYAALGNDVKTFEDLATGEDTSTEGNIEATFTLNGPMPNGYEEYIVDFVVSVITKDTNGFVIDLTGNTYLPSASEPSASVAIDAKNYNVEPNASGEYKIYLSDVWSKIKVASGVNDYSNKFIVSNVFNDAYIGGTAVAKVSNISGLDYDADVTIQMIMYDAKADKSSNYFALSNALAKTLTKSNFEEFAIGNLINDGTDGKGTYEVEFVLPTDESKYPGNDYDEYIVDFILNVETSDTVFKLDFDGKTAFANGTPTNVKVQLTSFEVKSETGVYAPIYFSDIFAKDTMNNGGRVYNSFFTLSNVWSAGKGGSATATVSNITDLDDTVDVSLTMIMYKDSDNKSNHMVLSKPVTGSVEKSKVAEVEI